MPMDATPRPQNPWALCTLGEGTVWAYIDKFCGVLLNIRDVMPSEVVDHFIHSLAAQVCAQLLEQDPSDFDNSELIVEGAPGDHSEPVHHLPA